MTVYINGTTGISGVDGSAGTPALQGTDANTGISFGSDVIIGSTGGSERWRTDASGRLLVGTSSARSNTFSGSVSQTFQIEGNTDTGRGAAIFSTVNGQPGGYLLLGHSKDGTIGGNALITNGDDLGLISFQGNDGSKFVEGARISAVVDGTSGVSDLPTRLVFSTTPDGAASPVERFKIGANGAAFFYSSTSALYVSTALGANASDVLFDGRYSSSSTGGGTLSFAVRTNGNVQNSNNSYTAISDIKLKENIVDAGSQWDDLKALRVRKYNLKEGQTHTQIGLIAQEVEPISPGLVYETIDRDGEGNDLGTTTKVVQYSVLYMKAVKALQEAMERIETLEAKVAALEAS